MDPLGKIMEPNGAPALGQTMNPTSSMPVPPPPLGQVAQPVAQAPSEAPAAPNTPEFQDRVKRNESFLAAPEVQAGLMQFALNMLSGGDLGNAIGSGFEASGRVASNRENQTEAERKAALDERQMQVSEGKLALDEQELLGKKKIAGQTKYSKLVSGDSPMGLELGIPKGQRARVEFTEDREGRVINASLQADPITGTKSTDTKVSQYLDEAIQAEKLGDTARAKLLREAANKEATGASMQGTLDPGTRLVQDPATGEQVVETIPGSKLASEQTAASGMKETKRVGEIQMALNVKRATDTALNTIAGSKFPDWTLTGFGSYLDNVRGTGANDLAKTLDTVKANLGFIKLQDIRDASKTGGALGAVSDFENRLLQATVANLENSQNSAQLVSNLKYVRAMFTDVEMQGRLSDIGHRLANGEINQAQAVSEAGQYLDTMVKGGDAAHIAAEKDLTNVPPPIQPPSNAPANVKKTWHNMDDTQKQRVMQLLDKAAQPE